MRTFIVSYLLLFATGCTVIHVSEYRNGVPRLDLFDYFSGKTMGYGIVQDRKGKLLRQFIVEIQGEKDSQKSLILDEEFTWNDGEVSKRIWRLTENSPSFYSGAAQDVVGIATGEQSGNALNWKYTLKVDVDGTSWNLNLDDWMFLQPDKVLINRATMSKFGFRVGEITIVFMK